jgi:hypothetical protein
VRDARLRFARWGRCIDGRRPAIVGSVFLAAIALLALSASTALGVYVHRDITGEYGKGGPKATQLGTGCKIDYHEASGRIYLFSDQQIYALERTGPGSVTPVGGGFPAPTSSGSSECTSAADLEVDQSTGRIFPVPTVGGFPGSPSQLFAYTPAGAPVGPPWPVNTGGATCGVTTTSSGEVWGGNYGLEQVTKFTSAGAPAGSLALGYTLCKIAVDPENNDLFVVNFNSNMKKYTAASGYTSTLDFGSQASGWPGIALNSAFDRIYVVDGPSIRAYDTNTAALVETITPGFNVSDITLDEATDTLFLSRHECCDGKGGPNASIVEIPGFIVPDVVTGDPIGNSAVSGSVDEAGGGPVTECYFEFGPTTAYGSTAPCEPAPPFAPTQAVTADLPGLEGPTVYHYRLVARNAKGKNFGGDKTIAPVNVVSLSTGPATNLERTTARLNGSFVGTDEAVSYFFEWEAVAAGSPSAFDNKTTEESAGVTTGPTPVHADIAGLTAGTAYRYRVVAKSPKGLERGQTVEFTTAPAVKSLTTTPATDLGVTFATLNGSLDPDGFDTTYYFEWGKTTAFGQVIPLPPGTELDDSSPGVENVSVKVSGLEPGTDYLYRIAAINSFGKTVGAPQSFKTRQAPTISSFSATNIRGTTADLTGVINPNGYETTYYFEYGPTKDYGLVEPIPVGTLPAATSVLDVVEPIAGLEERTYHFRLVATNEWGSVTSEDQSFDFKAPTGCPNHVLRQQTGAAYLPDCRAYELVSAPRLGGSVLFPQGPISPDATGRFAYAGWVTGIPDTGEPQNADEKLKDMYVATRSPSGWVSKYVGVPGSQGLVTTSSPGGEYGGHQSFGDDGGFNYPSAALADRSLDHFIVWDRKGMSSGNQIPGVGGWKVEGSNVPHVYDNEGRFLGKLPTNYAEVAGAEKDLGDQGWIGGARISPDYSNYAFSSIRTAFADEGLTAEPGSVYDNDIAAGTVRVISKTEAGADIPLDPLAQRAVEFLRIPAISTDGSHILMGAAAPPFEFFTATPKQNHLYMAVNQGDGTYEHYDITVDENGDNVGVVFEGMTSDGSQVFFTTSARMTDDDDDTSIDLYVWDKATNALTRVSDSGFVPGNSDSCGASWTTKCDVQTIPQSVETRFSDSEMARGSGDFYFYSPEQLDGAKGLHGKRNLYVYRDGGAHFVTALDPGGAITRVNVSPTGSHMAMITTTRLTPYDNEGHAMMYVYDAAAGGVKCVSCLPSGEAPTSDVTGSANGWFMTFDGRAFWSTKDAVVRRDANEAIDVYEFVEGRPQLISTGTGKEDAEATFGGDRSVGLLHVTGDGVDVFFATYDTLVPQDESEGEFKFYTARTNGGIPAPALSPPCVAADECHGEDSSAPPFPEIGTGAALGATGNHRIRANKKCKKKKRAGKRARASKVRCKPRRTGDGRKKRGRND